MNTYGWWWMRRIGALGAIAVCMAIGFAGRPAPASGWASFQLFGGGNTHEKITEHVLSWLERNKWEFGGRAIKAGEWDAAADGSETEIDCWWDGCHHSPASGLHFNESTYHGVAEKEKEKWQIWPDGKRPPGVPQGDRCNTTQLPEGWEEDHGAEKRAVVWALKARQEYQLYNNLDTARLYAGYAIHLAQDAVAPPHVDPWPQGGNFLLCWDEPAHTKLECYVNNHWSTYGSGIDPGAGGVLSSLPDLESLIVSMAAQTDNDWPDPSSPCDENSGWRGWKFGEAEELGKIDSQENEKRIEAALQRAAGLTRAILVCVFDLKQPPRSGAVDVMLIIDSSGSMSSNDPANKRRDAARSYLTASLAGDHVGVVDFDTSARLASGLRLLPDEKRALVNAVNTINSSGMTNIREGINGACQELVNHGQAARRGAILLTDGHHNQGPFGNPQQCFKDRGWPIYTFGFGSADTALLSRIAVDTGGEFAFAPTSNLVCEFQRVRTKIAGGTPGPCTAHHVDPGATTSFLAAVPPGQAQGTFSTSWMGSDVVMALTSPSGRVIDRNTVASDVVHDMGPTFEVYSIINPEPGDWQVNLFGADVPPGGEDVIFSTTTVPLPADVTPPVIALTITPPDPNSAGWYYGPVSVDWTVTDPESGTASASGCDDMTLSNETGGTVLTCTATNGAGLTASRSTPVIRIDMTQPITTATLDPPAPNGKRGWCISDVAVCLEAVDPVLGDGSPGSDVRETIYQVNGGSWQPYTGCFVVGTEGWDNVVEFYSTDYADNVEGTKGVHFKLDKTPQDISISDGVLGGLHWDQVHLERGILTNSDTLALSGGTTDNLCLWEVRAVDLDSGQVLDSEQPVSILIFPPPTPASMDYQLDVPLHQGINNIDVVAEDCAGWEKHLPIQVVYVIPGPYDPRSKGFWYNSVNTGKYSETDFQTLLDYVNVVSDVYGPATRNIYGLVSLANYRGILSPDTSDMETLQKAQLLATWLNLVSGRVAVLTPADLTKVKGWAQVVDNTGGSALTFALNVPMEAEEVDQTRLATRGVYEVAKTLLDAFNNRMIIP